MSRKGERDTSVDKECFSKSLNISILTQINSLILQRDMKDKLNGNALYLM